MVSSTTFVVQQVAPGVTRECSSDGCLMVFNVMDGSHQTVARWGNWVKNLLLQWPTDKPCYLLHDLHRSSFAAFDRLMQTECDELFRLRPDLERWVAVILPANDAALIARLSVRV